MCSSDLDMMFADAESMSLEAFCERYGDEDWVKEFYHNAVGDLDQQGVAEAPQDPINYNAAITGSYYEGKQMENRGKWDTVGRPENFGLSPYEVINRFPHEVRKFRRTGQVDDDLYHALYDWYLEKGEIPDEIMKDRDRDGREWIAMQLGHECDLEESGMYEGDVGVTPTAENREFDLDRLRKLAFGK